MKMTIGKWIKAGLLTTALIAVAAPALAQRDDDARRGDRRGGENRGDRNGSGPAGDRGSRADRPARAPAPAVAPAAMPRPAPVAQAAPDPRAQRGNVPRPGTSAAPAQTPPPRRDWSNDRANGGAADNRGPRGDERRDGDGGRRDNDRRDEGRRDGDRDRDRHDWGDRSGGRDWRYEPGRHVENRWDGWHRWDREWQRDRRYDWRDWRGRYHDRYRLPPYHVPYGWSRGYFRFSIGVYISNILFSSTYWIEDPYYYRLPPAYGPFRWVRYYNDALLVDIRDGYVVDVVYGVFW
jgi:hypothetical protein